METEPATNIMPSTGDDNAYLEPVATLWHPELVKFINHWNKIRGDRLFPGRKDLVLREIESLLPYVHMYNVDGENFSFRLVGNEIVKLFPLMDYRGETLSILPPQLAERLHKSMNWVIEHRAPVRGTSPAAATPGKEYRGIEVVFAPLSSNGTDIDIIIAVSMFEKS